MAFTLKFLNELGISPQQPAYLQQRVRVANQFALFVLPIVGGYAVLTYFLFPSLVLLPVVSTLLFSGVLLLNYLGVIWLSRLLVCLIPPLLVEVYHACLLRAADTPLPSFYLIQLAMLGIPWLIFDFREKAALFFSTLVGVLCILLLPIVNTWFELSVDDSFFRAGIGALIGSFSAVLVLAVTLYLIQGLNHISDQKNEAMVLDMEHRNQQLRKSEEELNAYVQQVEQAQQEEKKRQWASEGIASFGQILRSNHASLADLGDQVIAPLVKYVNANQGGLFILNQEESEPYLELVACYAYERKKYVKKKIDIGEGLLGQAYLEKETILLTDVPANYVRITSGLGEASPQCVLIVPLKMNELVVGVIELASFDVLQPHQIAFLEKLGENMAAMITNVRTNENVRRILQESQRQTEELRAGEEEMRQNLEELEATQEEMRRKEQAHLEEIERLAQLYQTNTTELRAKEAEMTGIFTAVNTSLATIEFSLLGEILTANDAFLQLMHTTMSDIRGQHHRRFVDSAYAESVAYDQFWQALKAGISQTDDFKRIRRDGSEVWMRASYTPVQDHNGRIFKVIKLAQDITERKLAEIEFQTLSLVADNTNNSVVITNPQGLIEYVNPGFTRLTGYTLAECVGRKPGSFLQGPDTDEQTIVRIREKMSAREPFYEEILNYDKAGNSYWISLAINPVFDSEGRVSKYISIQANVTDTKRRALDFTSQLEAISRASAIVEFDMQGYIQSANENFLQLMGYNLEQVKGQHHRLFVLPEDRESAAYLAFWQKLGRGEYESGEFKRVTQSGKEVWLKGHYNAILDITGKPYKVVKYALDTTLQKQLESTAQQQAEILRNQEEQMRQNLQQLQLTQEESENNARELEARMTAINSTLATIEFDLQGHILTANENFLQAMGYRFEELQHHSHRMLVDSAYAESAEYKQFWQDLRAGKAQIGKVKRLSKQGKVVWLNASYTPVMNRHNQLVKIIKLAQTIEA